MSKHKPNTQLVLTAKEINVLVQGLDQILKAYAGRYHPDELKQRLTVREIRDRIVLYLRHSAPNDDTLFLIKQASPLLAHELMTGKSANQFLDKGIDELGLSIRPVNALKICGITTVRQLLCLTKEELMDMRNMGALSIKEVISMLDAQKLKLGVPPENLF